MIDFAQAISDGLEARLSGVHVALPCRVESFDAAKNRAVLRPLIRHAYVDDDGVTQQEELPLINSVPVLFPGAGAVRITFPVQRGTIVLAIFAHKNLDRWLVKGGIVDDVPDRQHAIDDAVAIPGLFDFTSVPTAAPTDAMVLHGSAIKLGGADATDPVARKSDIQALVAALNSHIHTAPGGLSPAPTSPPTAAFTTPTCSATVKSK